MKDIILLKQGEVVLKGLNRRFFEQKLVTNIRKRLKPMGAFHVYCVQSTVYVEPEDELADMDAAFDALSKTFGVVALSRAAACEKDEDAIAKLAIEYLRDDMLAAESFKVETKRSDKSFHLTSIQLSQYVGGLLAEAYPETRVDVRHPELVVHLEVAATTRPMSTRRPPRARADCPSAPTAGPLRCSPAASTAPFPPG